jgi:hypothetical protein
MTQNTELNKFCYRYEARIERTGRYHRRAEPSPWRVNDYPDTSVVKQANFMNFTEVPMVAITLPEDRLGALIEHEKRVSDMIERKPMYPSKYSVLDHIIQEHEEECRLRHTNPALKKAWENYQMLLRMVK